MSYISLEKAMTALQNVSELGAELKVLREENIFLKKQNEQLIDALINSRPTVGDSHE